MTTALARRRLSPRRIARVGEVRARPRLRPLVFFVVIVIAAFFTMIFARISLDRTAFELQKLEDQISVEQARHGDLRVEIARLQDPGRITRAAASMGLVYPDERVSIEVPGLGGAGIEQERRRTELRALLAAQP